MEQVLILNPADRVCLNWGRVAQLQNQLGETVAQDVLSRAMEELTLRLDHTRQFYEKSELKEMRKCTRSLVAIADQIGLDTLTMVAEDVLTCLDSGDHVALAATCKRLMRTGKSSLSEIWDVQGLTV